MVCFSGYIIRYIICIKWLPRNFPFSVEVLLQNGREICIMNLFEL